MKSMMVEVVQREPCVAERPRCLTRAPSIKEGSWCGAQRGPAEDVRDPGLVAYVEDDSRNALKDLLGLRLGERERIRRGKRVCRYAVGIGSGVEGRWAARPVIERRTML